MNTEERRLSDFIEFIGEGRGSRALAKALESSEIKVNALQSEIEGLQQTRDKVFQAPPIDWIEEKLTELSNVLEQNTAQSAEVLRQVLGPIRMEATYPETGRPYYTAHTSIDTLAIIYKPTCSESSQKSSDMLRWWARSQYRRTSYQLPFQIKIYDPSKLPNYQQIAEKVLRLKELGLNCSSIARQINVDHKSVSKAINWIKEFDS